ncbi:MAG: hypothetical protein DI610_01885 [Staphylococcus hominis]|nr:MAG: hypothetical protein DI610_01885 [Staphylococcus hominis]
MLALVDCTNFYVSAERVFDPSLRGVPVLVLSNGDSCAVARSEEAKALHIKMGAPLFKIRDKVRRHGIRYLSSSYELYADMNRRFNQVLRTIRSPPSQPYWRVGDDHRSQELRRHLVEKRAQRMDRLVQGTADAERHTEPRCPG